MMDEWKATADRSLANTESILRSLNPSHSRKRYDGESAGDFSSYDKPTTPALDSLLGNSTGGFSSASQAVDTSEYHFRLHKASLTSEFDRFLADIKAELDARSTQVKPPATHRSRMGHHNNRNAFFP